jgi:hypothetical protein
MWYLRINFGDMAVRPGAHKLFAHSSSRAAANLGGRKHLLSALGRTGLAWKAETSETGVHFLSTQELRSLPAINRAARATAAVLFGRPARDPVVVIDGDESIGRIGDRSLDAIRRLDLASDWKWLSNNQAHIERTERHAFRGERWRTQVRLAAVERMLYVVASLFPGRRSRLQFDPVVRTELTKRMRRLGYRGDWVGPSGCFDWHYMRLRVARARANETIARLDDLIGQMLPQEPLPL